MRNNLLNLLLFAVLAVGFYFLWSHAEKNWLPKPPDPAAEARKKAEEAAAQKAADEAKRKEEERAREERTLAAAAAGGQLGVAGLDAKVRSDAAAAEEARRKADERAREEKTLAAAAAGSYPSVVVAPVRPKEPPPRLIAPGPYAAAGAEAPHFVGMVEELVAAIEEGREHRGSGRDGRWALEMIMGVYESHRRDGTRVPLPLADRGHPLQRWLQEAGLPTPPHPEARARDLRVA